MLESLLRPIARLPIGCVKADQVRTASCVYKLCRVGAPLIEFEWIDPDFTEEFGGLPVSSYQRAHVAYYELGENSADAPILASLGEGYAMPPIVWWNLLLFGQLSPEESHLRTDGDKTNGYNVCYALNKHGVLRAISTKRKEAGWIVSRWPTDAVEIWDAGCRIITLESVS